MSATEVLVVGSTGPIGRAVIAELTNRRIETLGVSRNTDPSCDIHDAKSVQELFAEVQLRSVIYLATPRTDTLTHADLTNELTAFRQFVGIAKKAGVSKFVFSSSAAVYGESSDLYARFSVNSATNGTSPYAVLKLKSEQILMEATTDAFLSTSARIFNVYGPGCNSSLIEQMIAGEATVWDTEVFVRDYIRVEQVANCLIEAAVGMDEPPSVMNLGSGHATSNAELLKWMGKRAKPIRADYSGGVSVSVSAQPAPGGDGLPSLDEYINFSAR